MRLSSIHNLTSKPPAVWLVMPDARFANVPETAPMPAAKLHT
jgi:hypothetical protein